MIGRSVEVVLTLTGWVAAYRRGYKHGQSDLAAKVVKAAAERLQHLHR